MHVILNVESLIKPSGGIGRYTRHLLNGLLNSSEVEQVSCFAGFSWVEVASLMPPVATNAATETTEPQPVVVQRSKLRLFLSSIPLLRKTVLRSLPFVYRAYAAYNAACFRYKTKTLKNALYHEPNYILKPFAGAAISTVHDLSHLHYPQYHPKERVAFLEKNLRLTLDNAAHILTDSEFVRNELITLMNVPPERVTAVLLGVDAEFHPRTQAQVAEVLAEHQLHYGQYLLSVATLEPRKNIAQLLDAYLLLDESIRRAYPLVLVGGDGWRNDELKQRITDLVAKGEVKHLGYIADEQLPLLFAAARGFVFVPFYEGFGLPPLEAMASGVPVLASNVSSIPEVVGDTGILVDPNGVTAIAAGMTQLLTNENWRTSAIERGLARAKTFTWQRCVQQTLAIYQRVMSSK
jgi:alpha-1,3-rhamnosyl/mannosyltransferase